MASVNVLYIAANILFDLGTGKTNQVLMLVTRESDASTFTSGEVNKYVQFVQARAANITWSVQPSKDQSGQYVIKGVQHVG